MKTSQQLISCLLPSLPAPILAIPRPEEKRWVHCKVLLNPHTPFPKPGVQAVQVLGAALAVIWLMVFKDVTAAQHLLPVNESSSHGASEGF